jgi:hypothetical protein
MHDNLTSDTVYYFAVIAYNAAGSSEMSEVVHCHTMSTSQSALPGNRNMTARFRRPAIYRLLEFCRIVI